MIFLLAVLMAAVTVLAYFLDRKNIIAPGVVVSGMFFISTVVAMLNLRAWQYDFRFLTVAVVVGGVLAFEAGEVCTDRFWMTRGRAVALARRRTGGREEKAPPEILTPAPVLAAVCLVMALLLVYYGAEIYRLSVSFGNPEGLRGMIKYARDAIVARRDISWLGNICAIFCQCTAYVLVFILIRNSVWYGVKKRYLLQALPAVLYVPFLLLSGARTGYIYLFAYAIVVWIFTYQGKHRWNSKNTRLFLLVGVGAILTFFLIFRFSGFLKDSGVGTTAWKSLSKYTGFSIAGLNSLLIKPWPKSIYFGEHTLNNVYSVLNKLGITHVKIASPFLPFTRLPGGVSSNVYTALARYIHDYTAGGMLGIMFVMGALYTAANNYLYYSGRRGFAMILYGTFFYPLVLISIDDVFLYGIISTTTVYQLVFYALLYWLFLGGGSKKLTAWAQRARKGRPRKGRSRRRADLSAVSDRTAASPAAASPAAASPAAASPAAASPAGETSGERKPARSGGLRPAARNILKNYAFSLTSNAVAFLISTLIVAVVPKVIGGTEYGYFQLYIFYSAYVGFFHLGWCDGIYLRYGGAYYDKLDKRRMSGQFWLLLAFETGVTAAILLVTWLRAPQQDTRFVLVVTALSIIVVIPKTMLSYVLQATNRIREYSLVTVAEKVVYCLLVIVSLALGSRYYKPLILADIAGKAVSLVLAAAYCRDLIFTRWEPFRRAAAETWQNISVGVKLMVANVAGMLILGIVRLAINDRWSIEVFGKVSLSLSVSNLLMVLVGAVGTVLFPLLKRVDGGRLQELYGRLRDCLMVPLFAVLVLFYPLRALLTLWLPQYAESFRYMALLFPVCVFDSKLQMLVNTYMKAMRQEKTLLRVNVITMLLSLATTAVTVYWLGNLELAVLSILVLFAFRCTLAESRLAKVMGLSVGRDMALELGLTAVFVIVTWFCGSWEACGLYAAAYAGYLILKKREVKALLSVLRTDVRA